MSGMPQIIIEGDECILRIPEGLNQNDWFAMRDWFTRSLLNQALRRFIVDCEAVHMLPSIAFGVLCSLTRDVTRQQGRLCLINVSSNIHDIMRRTHMHRIITICGNRREAAAYLAETSD